MKHLLPSWTMQATPKPYIWLTSPHKSNHILSSDVINSHTFTKLRMHWQGNRFCSHIQKEGQTLYLWLHPPPLPVEGCDMRPQWMERRACWCSGSNPTWNYVPGKKKKEVFWGFIYTTWADFKFPLNELIKVPSRHDPLWCWTMQSH